MKNFDGWQLPAHRKQDVQETKISRSRQKATIGLPECDESLHLCGGYRLYVVDITYELPTRRKKTILAKRWLPYAISKMAESCNPTEAMVLPA